jgi:hypothetical protein
MKRKSRTSGSKPYRRLEVPPGLGDFNINDEMDPKPPLIEYAVPLLDAATFAMLKATNPEEAALFLKANGPSAVEGRPEA